MSHASHPSPPAVTVARHAMATRFEIALHGADPGRLRAAAEEALGEIEALEDRLSLFRETSEISRINALAFHEPVQVAPDLFRLLAAAAAANAVSGGAFDITVAPLMRSWGFRGGIGSVPSPDALEAARAAVGMQWVELDEARRTVRFLRPGMCLDLGAIGKGYAIDVAVECLREAGVRSALIHGGTSTVYGLGSPPGADAWNVAVEWPARDGAEDPLLLAVVPLADLSLSVSAVWGKSFQSGGRELGHVLDPRTGQPAGHTSLAAVALESAMESDALSTALLVMGAEGAAAMEASRPLLRGLMAGPAGASAAGTPAKPWVRAVGGLVLRPV